MRTLALGLAAGILSAAPAHASVDLSRLFANCAGQFSAMVEHAWLMQDPAAESIEADRERFLQLLDAVDDANAPHVLSRRIEAKVALASLLSAATFTMDAVAARRAREAADAQISGCRLLLLEG